MEGRVVFSSYSLLILSLSQRTSYMPFLHNPSSLDPRGYKFEEPYLLSHKLVEGRKFLCSDLISKENLIAHGLSIQVEDPEDWIIDEYSSSGAQPGNPSFFFFYLHAMFLTLCESFITFVFFFFLILFPSRVLSMQIILK